MATISRIDKIIGLFGRIASLLWGSFAKETYDVVDRSYLHKPPHMNVCCSVVQRVAVCVWQSDAVCCSMSQCVAVCCSVLQCVAVCCSVLQCVAVC